MGIIEILSKAVEMNASDVFLIAGSPLTFHVSGRLEKIGETKLDWKETDALVKELFTLGKDRNVETFLEKGDEDFAVTIGGLARFRISAFKQRGSLAAVIRVIPFRLPQYKEKNIPEYVVKLGNQRNGMVLVTGPAASGKTTTLTCIIDRINHERSCHIVTLEDPIEFLHTHDKSIVSQREISLDTENYLTALKASLRQSPSVILLGEMRDHETINVALTASETGHLLLSTLHTSSAVDSVDRIIGGYPMEQRQQVLMQLSMVLKAVVSQQLVPAIGGGLVPAFEILTINHAVKNMIRDDKIHQIDGLLYSCAREEMISMDQSLIKLYRENKITKESAIAYASRPEMIEKKLG